VAATLAIASLACGSLPPQVHRSDACRCEVEAAWAFTPEALLDGEAHLGLSSLFPEAYLVARFVPLSSQDQVNTPGAILDNELLGDQVPVGTELPDRSEVDGRLAAVRELRGWGEPPVDLWAAAVPYDDGYLTLMAWSLTGDTEGYEAAVRLARSVHHEPLAMELPAGVAPIEDVGVPSAQAREELAGAAERAERSSDAAPPAGWEVVTYRSASAPERALTAWQSPPADGPRPGVLLLHDGFEPLSQPLLGDLDVFTDAGVAVVAPEVRGDRVGPHELFGGEVDDALAALRLLQERPDVDPDRVVVWGEGSGGTLALWVALQAEPVHGVVTLGAPTDLALTRRSYARLYGTEAYPADERQDVLRSPARFAGELRSEVHAWYGEFGDFMNQGWLFRHAAWLWGAEAPVHLRLVPRGVDGWWGDLRREVVGRLVAGDPLSDGAMAWRVGEAAWARRGPGLLDGYRALATDLHGMGVFTDAEVRGVVAEWRGALDARPALEASGEVVAADPPEHPDAAALRHAVNAWRQAGLHVRLALSDELGREQLREAFAQRTAPRGYVVIYQRDLLTGLAADEPYLPLSYGDREPNRDPVATRRVGEQVVAALKAAGLTPRWSGDEDDAIVVPWATEP